MDIDMTLGDFVEAKLQKFGDLPAYQCANNEITFNQLEVKSRQLGCWLQQHLKQGDRVAIQLPNINQYPIAAMAVIRAGMIVVNTNPLYTPREMAHQFKDSGAKAVIILSSLAANLEQVLAETDIEQVIMVEPLDLLMAPGTAVNATYTRLYDVLSGNEGVQLAPRERSNTYDIVMLQYTGGTTGVAKGACLTHHNILSNVAQVQARLGEFCREGCEVFICPLPLYHIYAFTVNMIYLFGIGTMNVLIPNPRDLDAFVGQISDLAFTGMSGINTLFVGLCNHPDFGALDFSRLKLTLSGGTALLPEVAVKWRKMTGATITEGYGLTETSPVAIFNHPGEEVIGSIGKPVMDTLIDIRDPLGRSVSQGEAGELVVKGPQVMSGYWQRPDATDAAFTQDGFFRTGDIATQKSTGHYYIVDRLKDMILVSGFNVYPNEVEAVLCSHPAVLEAAVVGAASEKSGEEVRAYVTLGAPKVTEEALLSFCRDNLTPYKVPRSIVILAELPKSAVGKILRRALRD